MRIMNNVSSLNAWRNLSGTDGSLGKNLERLSSGFRINRAADDVAGLAISENMRAQIRGFNQAVRNAQDGISLVQTAEGSLNEVHTMLQRMRELAVQASNGTLEPEDRGQIQTEMDNLTKEITRIANAAKFNNKDLINGSLSSLVSGAPGDITLQIGPNAGQTLTMGIGAMDAATLKLGRDVLTGIVDNGTAAGAAGQNTSNAGLDTAQTTVVSAGAGITAGKYQVKYEAGTQTVQLFDSAGTTAIGQKVSWKAGEVVELGDKNTAQTIKVRLAGGAPAADGTDTLRLGSGVGEVTNDVAADVMADTNGVTAVGYGLKSGDYTVRVTAGGVQLFNAAGTQAIGSIATTDIGGGALGANDTVDIGDTTTGRTVRVTLKNFAVGDGTITITNNEQSALNAQFTGGVKSKDAQVYAGLNVSSTSGASAALGVIDSAIAAVSAQRAQLGAVQNRLEHTISNLQVVSENLVASESRIRDVDMAQEMATFTKNQILMQAGTAMLAQANAKNQSVLSLLQ